MGYVETVGFRAGICLPYPVFDFLERRILKLQERPLIVMDVALRMYLKLNAEQALKEVRKLRERVKQHNGEFVILWHNSSFSTPEWSGFDDFLTSLFQ